MRNCLLILFLCSISLLALGQASKQTKPEVLFTVNKAPILSDEFIYLYKKNHQNKPEDFTEVKINEYLNLFINFKLKVAEARTLGMDTTAKFSKEFKTYREDLKKPYRAEPDALERLTKEAYDHLTQEVRASHILINLKPDAFPSDTLAAYKKIDDIRKRVAGGEDFEKLARELSEDPSAKYNGGDLGYFTAMQMVYPFEEAAYKTDKGKISNIVRTRFGYHLLKVIDKKPARGEVEVAHILLRTETADDTKIKTKAFEIFDQLKAGRPWDELCKENSQDANTKDTGGKLRAFGVGALASVPEFENTAFALAKPGDISDPFKSSIGWHIVRLDKKIPLPPYSEMAESLKRKVARDERLQISQQALNTKRRKDFAFSEVAENKKFLFDLADSTLTKGKWQYKADFASLSKPLFKVQTKSVSVGNFVNYIKTNQAPSSMIPAAHITQLYNFYVDEVITEVEEAMLIKEKPEFKNLLTEYREGILFFEIMEKEIWNRASQDTAGQRGFYERHKAKYVGGNRVEARIFSTTDKNLITDFKKKIEKGDTIQSADIKKFKSVQGFRNYEKGESKIIDNVTWSSGLHEIEIDKTFHLIEINRLVAPGTKSFEEARASIISDFQNELEQNWIALLRKKYPVQINQKVKKNVVTALVKK
jgi:peptidyl-prolyl cis-trans isomerase SurA